MRAGRHLLSRLERIERRDDDDIDLWSPRDALVMKALSLVLANYLPVSPRCMHFKGYLRGLEVRAAGSPETSAGEPLCVTNLC
jgi:hypothetical protein